MDLMANTPQYQRIADELRAQIFDGTLDAGAQLPTEAELMERYSTARYSIRQALGVLVAEGLVVSKRPLGHFVHAAKPLVYRPQAEFKKKEPNLDIFAQLLADEGEGRVPSQQIEVSIVQAPPKIRERLGAGENELLAARRRTRFINGEPYNTNDSYVRYELVKDSPYVVAADYEPGTNQLLADLGKPLVRALDEIQVRMPRPDEVSRLSLSPGTPVAEHLVTTLTFHDEPVQVTLNVLNANRHKIVFERTRTWPPVHEESKGTESA